MTIEIHEEKEEGTGWVFAAVVAKGGRMTHFLVRLSWMDYNLWSPDGSDRPEDVARAALAFLLSREPAAEIASEFDAARIRRRYPDADAEIPRLIESR
jgi:hypothetical protein